MKKILIFSLVILMMGIASIASAEYAQSAYSNVIDMNGEGQVNQPPMYVVRVRYGLAGNSTAALASGMVVSYDCNSADGVTVSACVGTYGPIAGVLVSALATQDSGSFDQDDNFGQMCIGGYCLANVDATNAGAGRQLKLAFDGTLIGYFDTTSQGVITASHDIGVLLTVPAADGNANAAIKLNLR